MNRGRHENRYTKLQAKIMFSFGTYLNGHPFIFHPPTVIQNFFPFQRKISNPRQCTSVTADRSRGIGISPAHEGIARLVVRRRLRSRGGVLVGASVGHDPRTEIMETAAKSICRADDDSSSFDVSVDGSGEVESEGGDFVAGHSRL